MPIVRKITFRILLTSSAGSILALYNPERFEGDLDSIRHSYLRGRSGEEDKYSPLVLSAAQDALQSREQPPYEY
ncbi:uncharacterized protein RSE6_00853 [Rhynchosporium secalis]|uniref:Uncharacterized protein n=1 Tax=Rhynchosporium secalis TaxID=38038 RepID=A0A1E1LWA0_RHYSE|nr:uncharacterized protein RSE6_00853 [Rhynchosporium secalis]